MAHVSGVTLLYLHVLYLEDLLLRIVAQANIVETSKVQKPSNFCGWRIPTVNTRLITACNFSCLLPLLKHPCLSVSAWVGSAYLGVL